MFITIGVEISSKKFRANGAVFVKIVSVTRTLVTEVKIFLLVFSIFSIDLGEFRHRTTPVAAFDEFWVVHKSGQ